MTYEELREALKDITLMCEPEMHIVHLNDTDIDKIIPLFATLCPLEEIKTIVDIASKTNPGAADKYYFDIGWEVVKFLNDKETNVNRLSLKRKEIILRAKQHARIAQLTTKPHDN